MTQFTHQFNKAPRWQRVLFYLAGALAFTPIFFMSREIVTGNFAGLDTSNADVLGTGSILLFFTMLAITPAVFLTGYRAIGPLRWWFGVMFFTNALVDLTIASIVTGEDFKGGFAGRVAGHTFLVLGTAAVLLTVILVATANRRSQKSLGKHWKSIQKLTYVVWVLILIHILLLFSGTLRFQQAMAASIPLFVFRIPAFQKWWKAERELNGWRSWKLWAVGIVLGGLFAWGYFHLVGEEINRGVDAISSHPHDTK